MNQIQDQLMTKEESYAERRKLFKDIWETSLNIDETDDIMNKPKVIKTLRLSEMDRCIAKKRKKQKIRNLRAVCNRLLDFCDRQDADDLLYEQMAAEGKIPTNWREVKIKRKKVVKVKKKIRKAKSLLERHNDVAKPARATTSERKHSKTVSRPTSPIKVKRTTVAFATKKTLKNKSPRVLSKSNMLGDSNKTRRRVVKKRRIKKHSTDLVIPTISKASHRYYSYM